MLCCIGVCVMMCCVVIMLCYICSLGLSTSLLAILSGSPVSSFHELSSYLLNVPNPSLHCTTFHCFAWLSLSLSCLHPYCSSFSPQSFCWPAGGQKQDSDGPRVHGLRWAVGVCRLQVCGFLMSVVCPLVCGIECSPFSGQGCF